MSLANSLFAALVREIDKGDQVADHVREALRSGRGPHHLDLFSVSFFMWRHGQECDDISFGA